MAVGVDEQLEPSTLNFELVEDSVQVIAHGRLAYVRIKLLSYLLVLQAVAYQLNDLQLALGERGYLYDFGVFRLARRVAPFRQNSAE